MKKKILGFITLTAFAAAVLFTVVAFLYSLLTGKKDIGALIADGTVWTLWGVLAAGAALFLFINFKPNWGKRVTKINKDLEDSRWLTRADMKKSPNLTVTNFKNLSAVSDGIPIFAEKKGRGIDIVLAKSIHTMVIGTTGSGKTSGFVDPVIQIFARTKTKPSLVITDPKGELYLHHAKTLEAQGYKILLIDLKDIYRSVKWNPFGEVIRKTDEMQSLRVRCERGKYYVGKDEFLTMDAAESEKAILKQQLNDEIYEDIQDIVYTTCPVENTNDATWQKGARDLIFALALGFWEDVRDGIMKARQFNFYNLYKNISNYCNDEMSEFKEFFTRRDPFSKTKGLSNTVLISQDKTLTSYLGDVNQYFNWMADTGISSFTSEDEIELSKFDEEPSALFLRIPDEKENRYKLVTLFITQLYKALVGKANRNEKIGKTKSEELMRNVYFIMDEFGNMPKFNSLEKIVTIGRSRKVFLIPVIQDFAQLENKYSKEVSNILKSNCNVKVFIGSTDANTIKEYSELCGKCKSKSVSFSEQKDLSVSTSAQERPLIYPSELQMLNDPPHRAGNAVVLAYGKYPLRAKFTPGFKAAELYTMQTGAFKKRAAEVFNEEEYFYDIVKRNNFIAEEERLKKLQDENFQSYINSGGADGDKEAADEKKEAPAVTAVRRLTERFLALGGKIPEEVLKELCAALSAAPEGVPETLDTLIDKAFSDGDQFLTFELASLKIFAEDLIKSIQKELQK